MPGMQILVCSVDCALFIFDTESLLENLVQVRSQPNSPSEEM